MTGAAVSRASGTDEARLARVAELCGAERLSEAESEVLRLLAHAPGDPRAQRVLALVRIKRGRLVEARAAFRGAVELEPADGAARLGLALLALKLGWWDEARRELGALVERNPDDARAWSFLGYAHARAGRTEDAARAFRRGGQPEVAAELERAGGQAPAAPAPPVPSDGTFRLAFGERAHARESALLALSGELAIEEMRRRAAGRTEDTPLGTGDDRFLACTGSGELRLGLPHGSRGMAEIPLDGGRLFLALDQVVAWTGDLEWSAGRVPRDGLPLLALAGTGRAIVAALGPDLVSLPVTEAAPVAAARTRLVGWRGAVVPRRSLRAEGPRAPIVIEGDGDVLLSKTPVRLA